MPPSASWRSVWRLSWPLIVAMFLQFSVGLADVYVAGRFGPAVQGAVGFAGQLLFFFTVFANAVGVGLVALVARAEGAGDAAAGWRAVRQGVLLAGAVAGILAGVGVVAAPGPAALGFLPPRVAAAAVPLLPWYAVALLPQALITVAAAAFRARGRVGWVLATAAVTAVLNLGGDFALAFGYLGLPAFGPSGIAVATAASSGVGAVAAGAALLGQGLGAVLVADGWRVRRDFAARLVRIAWPAGVLQLGWNLGTLVLYAVLGGLGTGAVAATAALTNGLRIEAVLYLPAFALNMVAAVLVGQALGAGEPDEAERAGWRVAFAATAALTLMALPVFVYSRQLAALLSPDPGVREATHVYLRFNMLSQPFMALSVCLGGGLQGAGDTRGTMKVVLGALWGLRIPLALAAAQFAGLGASGVWGAMVASQAVQGGWMAARFRRGRWKRAGAAVR